MVKEHPWLDCYTSVWIGGGERQRWQTVNRQVGPLLEVWKGLGERRLRESEGQVGVRAFSSLVYCTGELWREWREEKGSS